MKRAFFIISLKAGGAEKVVSTLLNEFARENFDIELICLEKNLFYTIDKKVNISFLSDFTGGESGLKKLLYMPYLAWKLKKYVQKNNISIIQSHLYRANYINILSKLLGSKHHVQIVNAGTASKYKQEGILGKINLFLIKTLYPKANLLVFKSQGMQEDMKQFIDITAIKHMVINNPYNIELIEKMSMEKVSDITFEKDTIYLINIARFETFKRQDHIIYAVKKLSKKYRIKLLLIGDGVKKQEMIDLSKNLGCESSIHFLGRVSNPYKYLAKSDIFVLSSDDGEGFPNVLVEAMICKTPVISSDCKSGPREILAPGTDIYYQLQNEIEMAQFGILFPKGNTEKLVDAIEKLINDKEMARSYIKKAYERAGEFSLEKIVQKYKKILS